MPDFDTRRPQKSNDPDKVRISLLANKLRALLIATRPRIQLIANRFRSLLIANRLRTLLISGGVLLFVVAAIPVGLLVYSSSGMGEQQKGLGKEGRGDMYASGDQQAVMAEQGSSDNVCTKAEHRLQEASNEELNGKIVFISQIHASVSAGASGASSARPSSAGPVSWYIDYFDICVMNADGTGLTNLTNSREFEGPPAWSPDGKRIAFVSYSDGQIYLMNGDGSNRTKLPQPVGLQPEAYAVSQLVSRDLAWSPDGETVAFHADCNIYIMPADGSSTPRKLTTVRDWQCARSPAWSPDGKQIAFSGHRGAEYDFDPDHIYVMDVSREGETNQWRQLTTGPASDLSPSWSPDGTEIAFVSGSAGIYKVDVSSLKKTRLTGGPGYGYPTWSPDGKKIAFKRDAEIAFETEDDALYVMNADGSNTIPIFVASGVSASAPDWQPLP